MPTQPDFALTRIGQIAIPVHDIEKAVAFYRGTLGMSFLFQAPGLAFFQCGTVRLMLTIPEGPEYDHPASIVYYTVADIEAAYRTLTARGVAFLATPHVVHRAEEHDMWIAAFKEADDNVLALMCERPRS